jgi:hypothetical protein
MDFFCVFVCIGFAIYFYGFMGALLTIGAASGAVMSILRYKIKLEEEKQFEGVE